MEKKQPKPITTQFPLGGQFKILCALTETNPDDPGSAPKVYHKIENLIKKLGIHKKIQHQVNATTHNIDIIPPTV